MTPNGARSWSVRVRTRDGRKLRATIGPYPTIGVHDARAHAQRIRADIGTAEKLAVFTQRASPRKRARPALHIAIDVIVRAEDHSGPAPMLASET
jgi:hypothetical protein